MRHDELLVFNCRNLLEINCRICWKILAVYIYAGKDKNKIRGDVFNNIFQLLSDYGSTMDNKDHGNNLLHKLLLEGRISVQEIELKRISFVLNKNTPVE